ncbi:MAG: hypothetical protein HDS66_09375 [Bacteroidales bacterium]|nr:hypothetical protein [Bacteroidales bacterium]
MATYTGGLDFIGVIKFGLYYAPCYDITANMTPVRDGSDVFVLSPTLFPPVSSVIEDVCTGLAEKGFLEKPSSAVTESTFSDQNNGSIVPSYEYSTSGGTTRGTGRCMFYNSSVNYCDFRINKWGSHLDSYQSQFSSWNSTTTPGYFRKGNKVYRGSFYATCDAARQETFRLNVYWAPSPDLINIFGAFEQDGFPGNVVDPNQPENPYGPGGDSGDGGGNGTFDDESDPIDVPSLPTLSSANTGFTRIYNPTLSQVQALANYLWTDESVIQTIWNHIKQYFENPMDAMIGFNLVPVPVPDGGTESFKLMYIDTGVSMTVAASQFVDVDCGSLKLEPYYGSALDYSPYTKISCFLPYIGNVSLNVDEVMGRTLVVKYRVDICSGSCVAYITVDGTVLYQYSGHCAIPIPFSSADFSSYVNSAISVGKLAGAALIGGAGAAMASSAQDAVQQTNQIVTTTHQTSTRSYPGTNRPTSVTEVSRVQTRESPADQSSTQASFSGLTPQNIANTVGQIMSSKPHIEHSGSFSGNSGYLGVRRPYLIIERPNMCMPADFQQFNGFPCMINLQLGSCSGFTRVQQVQLTGLSATNPEQAEIMELLKSGVIL